MVDDKKLAKLISEFVIGLLKKAKVTHAGNCLAMSEILCSYLKLFGVHTKVINVHVKRKKNRRNHYCLQMQSGEIIDATASQFKGMPKIYIGIRPENYL